MSTKAEISDPLAIGLLLVTNYRLSSHVAYKKYYLGKTTTVTGITGAIDSDERFSMSVDYPSTLKDDSDTETLDGNDPDNTVDAPPNYPPPKPPVASVAPATVVPNINKMSAKLAANNQQLDPIITNMRNLSRS